MNNSNRWMSANESALGARYKKLVILTHRQLNGTNYVHVVKNKIWRDMVENTNLTMNSKKAWATIRRLGADNVSPPVVTTVTADQIANQLLSNGRRVEHRRPPGEHHKTIVPSNNQPPTELTKPFSLEELATGLSLLKAGKAAGLDDLLTEMLQHLGNKAKSWLLDMLNECTHTKHIPSIWRKAKVIAIPKPGKDPSSPKNYSPISLSTVHSL